MRITTRIKRLLTTLENSQCALRDMAEELKRELEELQAVRVVKQESVSVCRYCKLPISPIDRATRECHDACYQAARREVVTGEKTWDELESAGKVGPARKGGRPSRRRSSG